MFLLIAGEAECGPVLAVLLTVRRFPSCSTAETAPLELGILGAFMIIGGGLFFLSTGADAAGATGAGACLMATGSASFAVAGAGSATFSWRALKFLFLRIGVAIAMEQGKTQTRIQDNRILEVKRV